MSQMPRRTLTLAILASAGLMVAACGQRDDSSHDAAQHEAGHDAAAMDEHAAHDHAHVVLTDALRAKLVAADKVDGTEDHAVSKCSGCALGMAGDPAHAIEVEGYTLHMCSASCKAYFEKDLKASIAALEIPQS